MQKIEYRIIPQDAHPTQPWLNREGADGWQMIAVLPNDPAKPAAGFKVIFSRPIQDHASISGDDIDTTAESVFPSSYRSLGK